MPSGQASSGMQFLPSMAFPLSEQTERTRCMPFVNRRLISHREGSFPRLNTFRERKSASCRKDSPYKMACTLGTAFHCNSTEPETPSSRSRPDSQIPSRRTITRSSPMRLTAGSLKSWVSIARRIRGNTAWANGRPTRSLFRKQHARQGRLPRTGRFSFPLS